MAFPSSLRSAVRDVAATVSAGELHPPRRAFLVDMDGEALRIPYRLYYDREPLRRRLRHSQALTRLICLCLATRHHDGYLRQECLRELLKSEEPWLTPFILQLASEYVVEIAEDVAKGIVERDAAALRAFASENPDYLATFERRMTSYWTSYHRQAYPERSAYPGARVLAALRSA